MAIRLEDRKAELIERLSERLHERLEGDDAALADAFARHYYRGVAPQDLVERDPLDLYGAALAHLRFGEQRRPGEAKVRVYNPQIEQNGWQSTHSVVEIVNDDMPFLVDSVTMALNRRGLMIHLVIHPVIAVRRDADGRLVEVLPDGDGAEGGFESFIHVEVDRHSSPETLAAIEADLREVLGELRVAVEDWKPILAKVDEALADLDPGVPVLDPEELAEAKELLRWIADHHFTFLGYACYDLLVEDNEEHLCRRVETGLGLLRRPPAKPVSQNFASLPPEVRRRALAPEPLIITKANTRSPVHRPAHLDYIGVKRFDHEGRVIGEHRFLGLFTSAAYNRSTREIPVLRRKVARIVARAGLPPASHDGKALINILETYPRDELFQTPDDELFRIAQGVLHLQERQQIRVFTRRDAYGRFVTCQVFVPRERYNTQLRQKMQGILQEALGGTEVEYQALVSESVLARILFTVRTPDGTFAEVDEGELEARLVEAARSWGDVLHEALIDAEGEEEGVRLYHAYVEAFPVAYREQVPAPAAVPDVLRIDRLAQGTDDLVMSLYRPLEADPGTLRFKLGRAGRAIPLSDALPVLENMGLRVIDEQPHELRAADGRVYWLHDFGMVPTADGPPFDLDAVRGDFQELFGRVWRGDAESDGFNRLVLLAGLDWRRVAVLRAYCKYMLQIGTPFSQAYIEQTLASNRELAARFARLFDARFDPDLGPERAERCAALEAEIRERLEAVVNLDEDRILRRYLHLVLATLRTNAFQQIGPGPEAGPGAQPYLSLKFDPNAIRDMPLPRPAFEIFLYSPRTEAVHLRGGKVARGGLRWSDRREDFRTEVLGLMKAQMVKNVVIVPVGAKGGFVLKRPPRGGDRGALREEAVACYRTFMRGMLDITDNRVGGEVVHPERVVRYDDDDPYLVVAADKGTADFSDIANGISESYGFWLGDAFASGGSQGYDHKGMGITARGAWESVKRMFYELGLDVQREPFTVVGIGDMSGDVFGNGMLLSEQIRLICAFDHRHIFIDPDPDPAVSYAERGRLFGLPRSSWDDYDRSKLSPGGGVYPRAVKSIPLSPEARAALGTDAEELSPPELIRTALTAPVDLLWNGGIGTFVKAAFERHADAADRTNDATRVNAEDLRCRVVGEGGNLGFTQKARIAFARKGGKINTDFIDNSAGVDTSDHEVNIKILLGAVEQAGDMTRKQRNELLALMTDEVAQLVLRDNILQVLAISMAEAEAPQLLDAQAAQMRRLEATGRLNRELELLPNDEALAERRKDGHGLTRPEIAVLIAYAKMDLYDELLASDLPDEPYFARDVVKYFPRPLRKRFRREILGHRLRREIVATQLANGIVNRTLGAFVDELREETGCGAAEVARAYIVARDAFDLVPLWGEIERLAACTPADLQIDVFNAARHVLERGVRWFMRQLPQPIAIEATVACFKPGVASVTAALEEVLPPSGREVLHERARAHVEDGADEALARRLAALPYRVPACEIVAVAGETDVEVIEAARVYFALESGLHLDRLRALLGRAEQRSRWDRLALAALQDDVFRAERRLAVQALSNGAAAAAERGEIEAWLALHGRGIERSRRLLAELEANPAPDVAMMSVAVRSLDSLSAVDRTAA